MTVYATTTTTDKRAEAAARLVEQHLAHRDAGLIVARMTRERRGVWLVKSDPTAAAHVVTLEPPTCDCGDELHRHPAGHCKHVQAVRLLTTKPAPAPTPMTGIGITADSVAVITRRPRVEPVEEV